MRLDPTKMKDWQIAEAAEATLRPAADLLGELGINDGEWDAYGRYLAKVDVTRVLRRIGGGDASKATVTCANGNCTITDGTVSEVCEDCVYDCKDCEPK